LHHYSKIRALVKKINEKNAQKRKSSCSIETCSEKKKILKNLNALEKMLTLYSLDK